MIDVAEITDLHQEMVVRWHAQDIDNPYDGFLNLVCEQLSFNFRIWHQEDIARSTDASDSEIAQVKRRIDKLNQQRNDWMEIIDDHLTDILAQRQITPSPDATLNTETPGSVIDRLAILALRIYHMAEQIERSDAGPEHRTACQRKRSICLIQHDDLSTSLTGLFDDIFAGRKRHKTYRQLKMYNDPTLNPFLYQTKRQAAG